MWRSKHLDGDGFDVTFGIGKGDVNRLDPDTNLREGDTSAAPQPAPTSVAIVTVRHDSADQPVTLSDAYGMDLDSLDRDWRVRDRNDVDASDTADIDFSSNSLYASNGADIAPADTGTYDECASALAYSPQIELARSAKYCVRTSEDRLASVEVVSLSVDPNDPVQLHAIVWDPPVETS